MGNTCETQMGGAKQQIGVTARAAAQELWWKRHKEGLEASKLREFKEQLRESCGGLTLRQAFSALGGDVLGRLKREAFASALRDLGAWESEAKADYLFSLLLQHTNAEKRPFVLESSFFELFDDEALLQDFWSQLKGKIQCWQVAFKRMDADKDGSISMADFRALLTGELAYTCDSLIERLGKLLGVEDGVSEEKLQELWNSGAHRSLPKLAPWMPRELRRRSRSTCHSSDCPWQQRHCGSSNAEESTAPSLTGDV